jgi:ABC-type antimicrobial peptide transport system permease subunit
VTTAITAVNPRLKVTTRTLASQVAESIRRERVLAQLSGVFGAMALFLAATGLFGITSYSVARRRRELAIRIAFGASLPAVARAVMAPVVAPIVAGLVLGGVLSTWVSRFASALFFGVVPGDLGMLLLASGVLLSAAVPAAWIPARRTRTVNPIEILRGS